MTVKAAGLCLDYSKNRIVDQTIKLLLQLPGRADRRDVRGFNGHIDIGSFEVQSHDDPGQHRGCALHRRVAPRREEDTVISGP